MNGLADLLTASRIVIVLNILSIGISRGEDRLLLVVALTALAWITHVLDGIFAGRTTIATRLGHFDLG